MPNRSAIAPVVDPVVSRDSHNCLTNPILLYRHQDKRLFNYFNMKLIFAAPDCICQLITVGIGENRVQISHQERLEVLVQLDVVDRRNHLRRVVDAGANQPNCHFFLIRIVGTDRQRSLEFTDLARFK